MHRQWRRFFYLGESMEAKSIQKKHEDRFFSKVKKTNGCWFWTGCLSSAGYGRIVINYTQHYAHRFSYVLHLGPIPEKHDIDHICHNRSCVNPDHLRAATRKQNLENQSRPHKGSASKYRGVIRDKKKWRAQVQHGGKVYKFGTYSTEEGAAKAALEARMRLFTHNAIDRQEMPHA